MRFVAETKITSASWSRQNLQEFEDSAFEFLKKLTVKNLDIVGSTVDLTSYNLVFPDRNFFKEDHLRQLLAAKHLAIKESEGLEHIQNLLLLAIAANIVHSSNMTRRADLRRRRNDEYKTRVVDVAQFIAETVKQIVNNIRALPLNMSPTVAISTNSRCLPTNFTGAFDLAITSPPYLNGTNYFRNTKLELWFLGFIQSEEQLTDFRKQAVCAGINNVSTARNDPLEFESVESVVKKFDRVEGDKRIPKMVRYYFSDMWEVISETYRVLKPGGRFVLDIGDSCFYGIHVPTEELLEEVIQTVGFSIKEKNILAERYSKDQFQLRQYELALQKPFVRLAKRKPNIVKLFSEEADLLTKVESESHIQSSSSDLITIIKDFSAKLPYKHEPYCRRNWGHKLHSLCSYQGKLKPAIAFWLVNLFVPKNGTVLDPLGGVGTIAFEAAMSGRHAVSNDKSPFASLVASAKLNPPSLRNALQCVEALGKKLSTIRLNKNDFEEAKFGLNATVAEYYHPKTLEEVLKARHIFLTEGRGNDVEIFLWASLLHILHGNRPYALSRRSHPITPFNPSGPAEYKSLVEKLRERIETALQEPLPSTFISGQGLNHDFRDLRKLVSKQFDAIITSPPFLGMRFDRPNWLRMWFCGWGERSFHEDSLSFLERQQSRSMDCYSEFFETCKVLLAPHGTLIIHIGAGENDNMPKELSVRASKYFAMVSEVTENVEGNENHGLRDKGRTKAHHYLFFRQK
jgi:DNA modification methylase